MRYAFGLVGLLVTLGVVVMLMNSELSYDKSVIKAGNKARDEAVQMNGVGARESINLELETNANGKNDAILVKGIIPGGPMEQFFGLKVGDKIIEITHNGYTQKIHEINIDPESEVLTAYQSFGQLTVLREGKQVTLPVKPIGANAAAANAQGNPSGKQSVVRGAEFGE